MRYSVYLTMTIDEQLAYLRKGTVDIIREEELRAKLEKSARTWKPLRVKLGADPTAPTFTWAIRL
jgi:tyrosyl-tRNA synthetase